MYDETRGLVTTTVRGTKMQKISLIIISLLFSQITIADVSSDVINKYLPGNWTSITEISGQRIESNTKYNKDKTVLYRILFTTPDGKYSFNGEGKWRVEGDNLVVTIISSSSPDFLKVGEVMKDKVTFIDSKQFSYVDEEGGAMTEFRN